MVTGTAVMQLVERGQLDLHRDVNDYLARFKLEPAFDKPVTMAHLLTHTGGFDDRYIGKSSPTAAGQAPLGDYLAEKMPRRVMPPGEIYTYSNHGMALAGHLVEAITQQDFAEYAKENLFKPLEMAHSSFRLPETLAPDLSKAYIYENGAYREVPFDFLNDYPAGQMIASGGDMAKFMIAHLQNGVYKGVRILREDTMAEMHRDHFTHHPRLHSASAYAFAAGAIRNRRLLSHDGGYAGVSTRLWLFPDAGIGIFVASNTMDGTLKDEITRRLVERFWEEDRGTGGSYPLTTLPAHDPRVDGFAGTYRLTRYPRSTFEKMGMLLGLTGFEMPIIAIGLSLVSLFYFMKSWRVAGMGWIARSAYALYAITAAVFVWFLQFWNLLGWQF